MRVLVAGGAGFIGSAVCRELLRRGHEAVCLDNLITGDLANIDDMAHDSRFSFVQANVTHTPLQSVDLILHLASPSSRGHCDELPIDTMLANSAGTHRLLALAEDVAARFVFASSAAIYGDPPERPQAESCRGSVDVLGARACYAEAKRFGEAMTMEFRRRRRVNASIVRIFNTYGPRMSIDDGRVVPSMITAAFEGHPMPVHGDGTQTRSFCYIDDLVTALLLVAFDGSADGEVFNIGGTQEVSMLDLAHEISAACGADGAVHHLAARPVDAARRCPDVSKMRGRYGWEPAIRLADGLRQTIAYVRASLSEREEAAAA